MKKRMRKIQFDSWVSNGTKSIIYLLVTFVSVLLFGCSLYFYYGNSLAQRLADSMDLSIRFYNDNYYCDHVLSSFVSKLNRDRVLMDWPEHNVEMYEYILPSLDELMKEPEVAYGSYNIVKTWELESGDSYDFYGFQTSQFLEREGIRVFEGTADISDSECIVPKQLIIKGSRERVSYQIGDRIDAYSYTGSGEKVIIHSYVVKGIYQYENEVNFAGIDDDFKGSNGILVTNHSLQNILDEHPEQYGEKLDEVIIGYEGYHIDPTTVDVEIPLEVEYTEELINELYGSSETLIDPKYFDENGNLLEEEVYKDYAYYAPLVAPVTITPPNINHIEILCKTYKDYQVLRPKVNRWLDKYNEKIDEIFENEELDHESFQVPLVLEDNNLEPIIKSIQKIVNLYEVIIMSVFMILLISLYSFLDYLQKGKTREIFIYYSMGKTKRNIVKYYIGYYLKVALPITIIASLAGYLASAGLSHWVFVSNLTRQREFIHAQILHLNTEFNLFQVDIQTFLIVTMAVIVISLILQALFITITTYRILHGKLRDHARGGN